MTIISCPQCDWTGHHYLVKTIEAEDVRTIAAGSPMPHGHCPECNALIPFNPSHELDGIKRTEYRWTDARPERKNLTQFQRDCLLTILARLDPDHPGFSASPEIAVALSSTSGSEIPIPDDRAPPFNSLTMAPYMKSWVYPLIVGALYGETFHGQRSYVADDAASIRTALRNHTTNKEGT